jgi:hypothetical protein
VTYWDVSKNMAWYGCQFVQVSEVLVFSAAIIGPVGGVDAI